jgi:hypothetical protein
LAWLGLAWLGLAWLGLAWSCGLSREEGNMAFLLNIRENGKDFVCVGDITQKNLSFT